MTAADDTPQWRAQQTSPLAIVSMVCGMVALVLGPLAILAIVFGHIVRGQVRRTGEGGRGIATAGLILGYLVLIVGIALVVAFLASLPSWLATVQTLATGDQHSMTKRASRDYAGALAIKAIACTALWPSHRCPSGWPLTIATAITERGDADHRIPDQFEDPPFGAATRLVLLGL
jgi:hypothetical protein